MRSIVKNSVKCVLLSAGRICPSGAVPILLYHSVDDSQMEDSVSPAAFLRQMYCLRDMGYQVIPLSEAARYARNGNGGKALRILAITFDDGYKSLCRNAVPILERLRFPATVFLPTRHVGGRSEWVQPSAPLLAWEEIRVMESQGILFGSHGHSHRDLTALTPDGVREELETSKKVLEDNLGKPAVHIAFPFSKSNETVERLSFECGYEILFSAIGLDMSRPPADCPIVLRRSVMKKDNMFAFRFVLANTYSCYFDLQRLLRCRSARGHHDCRDRSRCEGGMAV